MIRTQIKISQYVLDTNFTNLFGNYWDIYIHMNRMFWNIQWPRTTHSNFIIVKECWYDSCIMPPSFFWGIWRWRNETIRIYSIVVEVAEAVGFGPSKMVLTEFFRCWFGAIPDGRGCCCCWGASMLCKDAGNLWTRQGGLSTNMSWNLSGAYAALLLEKAISVKERGKAVDSVNSFRRFRVTGIM